MFRFPVLETNFGMVGLILGRDIAFPEAVRSLALEGAQVIVLGANWETQNMNEWLTYLAARSRIRLSSQLRIGSVETIPMRSGGDGAVVGPRGETLAQVGRDESDRPKEAYAIAKVDLDLVKNIAKNSRSCRAASRWHTARL